MRSAPAVFKVRGVIAEVMLDDVSMGGLCYCAENGPKVVPLHRRA